MSDDGSGLLGRRKEELDTPVLVVDLSAFEANLQRLATFFREQGTGWRPHSKSHKCPAIARLELAAGALGITCAKVSEAELLARAGIGPLLVANEVVTPQKLARLASLQRLTEVLSAVDNVAVLPRLAAAAAQAGTPLPVLIEVDLGMHRVGVQPGAPALALAEAIARTPGVTLRGVMGYEGHVLNITPREAKVQACQQALSLLLESADLIRRQGIDVPVVSAGGTGCYDITGAAAGITEVQAGGGIFMDRMYRDQFGVATLECSLTLLATVTSRTGQRVVLDSGFKALSAYHQAPAPAAGEAMTLRYLSAEHGVFELAEGEEGPAIGDQVELLVGYSDSTNFLHDHIVGVRHGIVEQVFAIEGRGLLT